MKIPIVLLLILHSFELSGQKIPKIETSDIDRFWLSYDKLPEALSKEDSINIFQENYINKASDDFKKFLKVREFTAGEYVAVIKAYPKFWKSIRPLTLDISNRKKEIENVLNQLSGVLPGFKAPNVCFAIGCLRTGGTTSKDLILIGSEIAASDSTVDKSEFKGWLNDVIGNNGDIVSMVAHEAVHTQQSGFPFDEIFALLKHKQLNLLNMSITEGSCDFITIHFLELNINSAIHQYGELHQCELFTEFKTAIEENPFDYSNFLYNGTQSKERPADLGYYIGSVITEDYFNKMTDKKRALKTILKRGKYKKVYRESGFQTKKCS